MVRAYTRRSTGGITIAVLLAGALTLTACSATNSSDSTAAGSGATPANLKLAIDFPTNNPAGNAFSTLVSEASSLSGGKIKINLYPNAELYTGPAATQAVSTGALDMAGVNPDSSASLVPAMNALVLPFVATSQQQMEEVVTADSPIMKLLVQEAASKNMVLLPGQAIPGSVAVIVKGNVTQLDGSLKGKKIRVPGGAVLEGLIGGLGGSPVSLATTAVATAITTGSIQGAAGTYALAVSMGTEKGYTVLDFGFFAAAGYQLLINKATWNRLSPADQQIIQKAWADGTAANQSALAAANDASKQQFTAGGGTVYALSPADTAQLNDIARSIWSNFNKTNAQATSAMATAVKAAGVTPPFAS